MNSNYDEIQPLLLKSEKVEKQSNEIFSLQGTTLKMRQRNEEDNAGRSVKGRPAGGAFMGRRTFLTYYTLSTTLPTVHYLPTTHCPPPYPLSTTYLLHTVHHLPTTTTYSLPPVHHLLNQWTFQKMNIGQYTHYLTQAYTLPTVQGSKFRRSSNTWCLPHNVNCVPHTSKLVRKTCGVYHVYVMLCPASRLSISITNSFSSFCPAWDQDMPPGPPPSMLLPGLMGRINQLSVISHWSREDDRSPPVDY